MDISKIIGTNLTALMDGPQGLDTCKKVAAKSGVGFGTVQRAKNGDTNITVEKLAAIAKAFHIHPAELMIEKPEIPYNAIDDEKTIEGRAHRIAEPPPIPYIELNPKSKRDLRIDAITALINATDMEGLAVLLHEAEKIAKQYPVAKQTPASSQ